MLTAQIITAITRQVQTRFPEMNGCTPKIRNQAAPKSTVPTNQAAPRYLITFHKETALPSGEKIARLIRVVVDEQGKILKITTSR